MKQAGAPAQPGPTGPSPVGVTSLWLKDTSRPDPWAAGANVRELMVSLWYPAAAADGPRARYMTPAESGLQLTGRGITSVPPDALSTVRVNAPCGSPPGSPWTRPGGGGGRRWRRGGPRTSRSCSASWPGTYHQHLRDEPQPLLDQPSPRYPEVTFWAPA